MFFYEKDLPTKADFSPSPTLKKIDFCEFFKKGDLYA